MREIIGAMLMLLLLMILNRAGLFIITDKDKITKGMTLPYFEGQADAINGDIRVDVKNDCWIKSPWDNQDKPYIKEMCKQSF